MSDNAVTGEALGFPSLTKALYAWSFFAIGIMGVVALLLGNDAGEVVEEMNSDPAAMALIVYEILSAVSIFSAAFNLYAFVTLALTLVAGYRLLRGAMILKGISAVLGKAGATISIIGTLLAFVGYAVIAPTMSARVLGPLVLIPLPLPWPLAIGIPLWVIGTLIYAVATALVFASQGDIRGRRYSELLAFGLILLVIPLLGMVVALFASTKLERVGT